MKSLNNHRHIFLSLSLFLIFLFFYLKEKFFSWFFFYFLLFFMTKIRRKKKPKIITKMWRRGEGNWAYEVYSSLRASFQKYGNNLYFFFIVVVIMQFWYLFSQQILAANSQIKITRKKKVDWVKSLKNVIIFFSVYFF